MYNRDYLETSFCLLGALGPGLWSVDPQSNSPSGAECGSRMEKSKENCMEIVKIVILINQKKNSCNKGAETFLSGNSSCGIFIT